jgi:hypothetical protein
MTETSWLKLCEGEGARRGFIKNKGIPSTSMNIILKLNKK